MTFVATRNYPDPVPVPTDLVATELDSHAFTRLFGEPFPGWVSKTFGEYRGPEWAWRNPLTHTMVKAIDIDGKIVLAISKPEDFYEFLAFVEQKKTQARAGS